MRPIGGSSFLTAGTSEAWRRGQIRYGRCTCRWTTPTRRLSWSSTTGVRSRSGWGRSTRSAASRCAPDPLGARFSGSGSRGGTPPRPVCTNPNSFTWGEWSCRDIDAAKDFYKPPICPLYVSTWPDCLRRLQHPTGPNKQSGGDQDDAQDQLALDQLHNADHDKDGGNNPQNGCTHGAILTLGSPALSPLLPGRLRSCGLLQTEHRFGSVSSPSGRRRPSLRGGCYNQLCNPSDGGTWVDAGVGVHGSRFASWNGRISASSSPPSTSCTRRVGLVVRN